MFETFGFATYLEKAKVSCTFVAALFNLKCIHKCIKQMYTGIYIQIQSTTCTVEDIQRQCSFKNFHSS